MADTTIHTSIREAALELAHYNVASEPAIQKIYLFPDEQEIRLVELDPTTLPTQVVSPFYFAASPDDGLPYRSAIALIQPEGEGNLPTPDGWNWNEAEVIWERN